jgi:hypothetical protein
MQGLTAVFNQLVKNAPEADTNFHYMEENGPVVDLPLCLSLCEALETVVMTMSPLTADQATKLLYTDARLLWLYQHERELDQCIQLATRGCNQAQRPVPICVYICATWLSVCRRTSFLGIKRALEYEWKVCLKQHEVLYHKLSLF